MPSDALADTDVLVLAGGRGTRLRPVLPDRQKVVADVSGEPFLARLVRFFANSGARRIVFAIGHRAEQVQDFIATCDLADVELVVSHEERPLGTAGAIRHALPLLRGDAFVVANGDSFAALDLAALVASHREWRARMTLALVRVQDVSRYGSVDITDGSAVRSFVEKSTDADPPRGGLVNAGIYAMDRGVAVDLPEAVPLSLERDVLPGLIGHGLFGFVSDAPFIDIGTPESWRAAGDFFDRLEARDLSA